MICVLSALSCSGVRLAGLKEREISSSLLTTTPLAEDDASAASVEALAGCDGDGAEGAGVD